MLEPEVTEQTAVLKLICMTMGRECVCHIYESRRAPFKCLRCDAIESANKYWPHLVAALELAQTTLDTNNGI